MIPQAVFNELHAAGAAETVRDWAQNLPVWVEVRQTHLTSNASLNILDAGEREAILLARELVADLLLIDDRQARQAAVNLGVAITGTIGILDKAAQTGLIDLRTVIEKLRKTNFHIAEDLIQRLLENER